MKKKNVSKVFAKKRNSKFVRNATHLQGVSVFDKLQHEKCQNQDKIYSLFSLNITTPEPITETTPLTLHLTLYLVFINVMETLLFGTSKKAKTSFGPPI